MSSTHTPTAFEQELLELLNRARLAPVAEFDALIADAAAGTAVQANITDALTYFGVDLESFRAQLAGEEAVAALAWNGNLATAADGHSRQMIDADTQSHRLPGEASLGDRVTAAGYRNWTGVSENVYAYAQDALYAHAGFFIDWGYDSTDITGDTLRSDWRRAGDGIQDPAGHRIAILNGASTEVGISALLETDPTTEVGRWVVTQNFGNRTDYRAQILGVVIDDADGDRFYDQGEGLAGVTLMAEGAAGLFSTASWASGGYQMVLPEGAYTVTAYGGALGGFARYDVVMGSQNLKLDIRRQDSRSLEDGLSGGAGDERMVAIPGLRWMDGGAGADTLTGSAGDDLLAGDDLPLAALLSEDSAAAGAQVFRLYGATLGRQPDAAGYLGWTEALQSGAQSLSEVAAGFVSSREFQATYGPLDDTAFVTLLYQNVLGRAPDATGLRGWLDALAGGRSHTDVVLGLSESSEYKAQTIASAGGFVAASDPAGWSDDVYRLYRATLDRAPDAAGFDGWTGALAAGRSLGTVAAGFVDSREFQNVYGALDDAGFVTLLYDNVLSRAPDAGGLADWTARLGAGATRSDVLLGFSQSLEFAAATASALTGFMRDLGGGDVLAGGTGNDVLVGGLHGDTFIFAPGGGSDRVLDLEAWDRIDLTAFGYATEAEALRRFSQVGADTVFAEGAARVVFEETGLDTLEEAMLLV